MSRYFLVKCPRWRMRRDIEKNNALDNVVELEPFHTENGICFKEKSK